MTTGIIMSSAPVQNELAAELGPLPAAFVPVGNRRLLHHQIDLLRSHADRILVTLATDRRSARWDAEELRALPVEVIYLPGDLSLGDALLAAVLRADIGEDSLIVLHGDTLYGDLNELPADGLFAHRSDAPYAWAHVVSMADGSVHIEERFATDVEASPGEPLVASGGFAFAKPMRLLQALALEHGRFVPAVAHYARSRTTFEVIEATTPWWDFGHVGTYHESRRHWLATRHFNNLEFRGGVVAKVGSDSPKLAREARWYESLPLELQLHAPRYLGRVADGGYLLGYEFLSPLSDLYVHGDLSGIQWQRAMGAVAEYVELLQSHGRGEQRARHCFEALVVEKSRARLGPTLQALGLTPTTPLRHRGQIFGPLPEVVERAIAAATASYRPRPAFVHGDLCFSNLLYDQRTQRVLGLDPRGLGRATDAAGDVAYDLAKLWHSVNGHYDSLLAGRYRLEAGEEDSQNLTLQYPPASDTVRDLFFRIVLDKDDQLQEHLRWLAVLLFVTMIPLHPEDKQRQKAFLCRALDLLEPV